MVSGIIIWLALIAAFVIIFHKHIEVHFPIFLIKNKKIGEWIYKRCQKHTRLIKAYGLLRDAYRASDNPLVRSRLKEMALSSLRLVPRGEIDGDRMTALFAEAAEVFKGHWLQGAPDFFYADLLGQLGMARRPALLADLDAGRIGTPKGFSASTTLSTSSAVIGSKYSRSDVS